MGTYVYGEGRGTERKEYGRGERRKGRNGREGQELKVETPLHQILRTPLSGITYWHG